MRPVSRLLVMGSVVMISAATAAQAEGPADAASAEPAPVPSAPASASPYDLQQLPAVSGTVAHYTLTPRGDVDGLVLTDGTEIGFPPRLSTALVFAVKPGDAVTAHGLKAYSVAMIAAVSITNNASNVTVVDAGPGGPQGPSRPMSVQGRIQATLHGPRGEVNGAVLDDGTVVRLPPPEAERFANILLPGQSLQAEGRGLSTPMGRVVEVTAIAQLGAPLSAVQAPPPPMPPEGPKPPRP